MEFGEFCSIYCMASLSVPFMAIILGFIYHFFLGSYTKLWAFRKPDIFGCAFYDLQSPNMMLLTLESKMSIKANVLTCF